jgi:hypothetical protein
VEAPGAALGLEAALGAVLDRVIVPVRAAKDAAVEADKAAAAGADKAAVAFTDAAVEADKAAASASRDSAMVRANCAFPCFLSL